MKRKKRDQWKKERKKGRNVGRIMGFRSTWVTGKGRKRRKHGRGEGRSRERGKNKRKTWMEINED